VANLELGECSGPPAGSRAGRGQGQSPPPEAKSFFGYPKLSFIGGSSAAGSPRVKSLVETFAPLAGPILREWRAIFISEKFCSEDVTKSNLKMDKINRK